MRFQTGSSADRHIKTQRAALLTELTFISYTKLGHYAQILFGWLWVIPCGLVTWCAAAAAAQAGIAVGTLYHELFLLTMQHVGGMSYTKDGPL